MPCSHFSIYVERLLFYCSVHLLYPRGLLNYFYPASKHSTGIEVYYGTIEKKTR